MAKTTQPTVSAESRPGVLAAVSAALRAAGVDMLGAGEYSAAARSAWP